MSIGKNVIFLFSSLVLSAGLSLSSALAASPPQPVISSFSPTSGPVGTFVTLTGTGFTGANQVWLGSAHNIAVTVASDTSAKFTVPSGATTGLIVILNSVHSGFSKSNFTITATDPHPVINSFSPSSGPAGTVVTVSGTGFTGANQVWLGESHGITPTVLSDTSLKFTVPSGAVTSQMAILNPQTSGWSFGKFTVTAPNPQPEISSFTPASGPVGTLVSISGSGFTGANQIWLGSTHNIAVNVMSDSSVNFNVPKGATSGQIAILNPQHSGFSSKNFTVTTSASPSPSPSPTKSASPSPSPTVSVTPTPIPSSSAAPGSGNLSVHVSGNKLANGSGETLQLRGANMSGLEFIGVQGGTVSNWSGTIPNWPLFKTWNANAVRIPLNVGSWLGLTTYTVTGHNATSFGAQVNDDPQGNYKQTVLAAVAAAQAQGFYVILDLHWSAPQVTLGGVTHYITPDGQPEFMNSSTDLTFWTSMAKTFGTQASPQPGISNAGVIFELFNEPYIDYYAGGATLYDLMLNGGTVAQYTWAIGAKSVSPTGGVGIAGYQQALDAIRATGAHNICIINGPSWTQEAQNYKSWFPTDSLSPPQLAAGWHAYPNGQYPYSNGDVYGQIGSDAGAGTAQFAQWFEAILNNGIPVLITEDGGEGGLDATSGEPHMAYMESWADAHTASYIAWEWTEPQAYGTVKTNNALTSMSAKSNGTIVPLMGAGETLYNWLLSH